MKTESDAFIVGMSAGLVIGVAVMVFVISRGVAWQTAAGIGALAGLIAGGIAGICSLKLLNKD